MKKILLLLVLMLSLSIQAEHIVVIPLSNDTVTMTFVSNSINGLYPHEYVKIEYNNADEYSMIYSNNLGSNFRTLYILRCICMIAFITVIVLGIIVGLLNFRIFKRKNKRNENIRYVFTKMFYEQFCTTLFIYLIFSFQLLQNHFIIII